MPGFSINITIKRDLDTVLKALLNPENMVHWTSHLERFEVVEGNPGKVGSIARLHYNQRGRTYIMEDKLIFCEPGKKYIAEVSGNGLRAQVETLLNAENGNTRIQLTWTGKAGNFLLNLLLFLMRGKIIGLAQKDLDTFKYLVETRGAKFG